MPDTASSILSFDIAKEEKIARIIEALFFASERAISIDEIRRTIVKEYPMTKKGIQKVLAHLEKTYIQQDRAFRLHKTAEGYTLKTCPEYAPYILLLHKKKRIEKLSPASMEALAIVAYKQPITRVEIEAIRGVDSSGVLNALQERSLIEAVGTKQVPGRPVLFGTTKTFLSHMGIKTIDELPPFQSLFPQREKSA